MSTTRVDLDPLHIFQRHELTHFLFMMYTVLNQALDAEADTLRLGARRAVWSRGQTELGHFDFVIPPEVFAQALTTILARDPQAQQHVQIVAHNGLEQQYRLS